MALNRITFVSEAVTFGGHEGMALCAAGALSRRGHHIVFRCWDGNRRLRKGIDEQNANGASIEVDTHRIGDVRLGSLRWWARRKAFATARRWLESDPSDVRVLVQGRIDSGLVSAHAGVAVGSRLISYLPMAHTLKEMGVSTLPGARERVLAMHYRAPAGFVTIDAGVSEQLRARGVDGPIELVENWIPAPAARPDQIASRKKLGIPLTVPVVATIGRIDYMQKGHGHLLTALDSPAGRASGIHWLVVGDGPDGRRLRKDVDAVGLTARCHFVPWIEGGMEAVYAAVDAVVLPSNFEGVPLVMLEALARQVPVAASRIDGMARWLPADCTFDRHDKDSVFRAVERAIGGGAELFGDAFARAMRATDESHFGEAWLRALERLRSVDRS